MNYKNISLLAYGIAIATLIGQLLAFVPSPFEDPAILMRVRNFLSVIWLNVFYNRLFIFEVLDRQYINLLVILGGILMLTGALLYTTSSGRRTALLRFMFAVVFVDGTTSFVEGAIVSESSVFFRILSAIVWPACAYGSFLALKSLGNTMQIETAPDETYGVQMPVEAPKYKRLFNLMIDNTMQVLLFSSFMPLYNLIQDIEARFSAQISMTVFFLITRLVYYPFFETVFGATPGKFATGTKVIDFSTNEAPEFKSIVGRTLSRFIPFDALSFGGARGWHDRLSNTRVVNEINTATNTAPVEGYENIIDRMEQVNS